MRSWMLAYFNWRERVCWSIRYSETLPDPFKFRYAVWHTFPFYSCVTAMWLLFCDCQARQVGINFEIMSHCNEAVLLRDVMVHADVHKLGQVVRNLVSNALKFTPKGGVV